MPKYKYTKLRVMCLEAPWFRIDQLREAAEYLKTVPQTGYTGLVAVTNFKDDLINLRPEPMLQLKDILGKTPKEVWDLFDKAVDEKVRSHRTRRLNPFKV